MLVHDNKCLQESDDILDYISTLDSSLSPTNLESHSIVKSAIKGLPTNTNKPITLLQTLNEIVESSEYLGGNKFSISDCTALPFLQRIKETHGLEGYDYLELYYSKISGSDFFKKSVSDEWWWWW